MLEKAIQIAVSAHRGQMDRGGEPYILHPMRVMLEQKTTVCKICAILHDVVEDTDVTLADLKREGFSDEVLAAVETLTKRDGEAYDDYIDRVLQNPIAMQVKLIDLTDNMDLTRMDATDASDMKRYCKYEKAMERILEALQPGEPELDEEMLEIEINGAVSVPKDVTVDLFASAFLKFVEQHRWSFGGGFRGL